MNHFEENKIDIDGPEDQKEFIENNKLILKSQQRFKSEKHNAFIEEVYKIALSSNGDKIMQSFDSIETYSHGTSKQLVCKKEKIKYNNNII